MLPSIVRALVISWLVALCAVTAGAPTARAQRTDPHAASISSASAGHDANVAPRRHGHDAPEQRIAFLATLAPSLSIIAPPRVAVLGPHTAPARPLVSLVLSRSSRGPPLG